jgi:hypothetical protein
MKRSDWVGTWEKTKREFCRTPDSIRRMFANLFRNENNRQFKQGFGQSKALL